VKGIAALGAVGGFANSVAAAPNVIVLHSATEDAIDYQFTVSGGLRKTTSSGGAPVDESAITTDPEDDRDGSTVHGTTAGGYDAYRYTGQITQFDVVDCNRADVWINGQKVDACRLPDGSNDGGSTPASPELNGVIELRGGRSAPVSYLIRVSGRIYSTRRHSRQSDYQQVEWQLGGGEPTWDRYRFSGHIERLQTSDGAVDIVIQQ
jgi:hypothetical protein